MTPITITKVWMTSQDPCNDSRPVWKQLFDWFMRTKDKKQYKVTCKFMTPNVTEIRRGDLITLDTDDTFMVEFVGNHSVTVTSVVSLFGEELDLLLEYVGKAKIVMHTHNG